MRTNLYCFPFGNYLLPGALKWLHEFPSPSPLPKAWGEGSGEGYDLANVIY